MSSEQVPLLFFKPVPGVDPMGVARALLGASPSPAVLPLDPQPLLRTVRDTRGFARLKVTLPRFRFDDPRAEAGLEGTAASTHVRVGFYGNVEKVAGPLFRVLAAAGLACYSVWDGAMLPAWPTSDEPAVDGGFAARMNRILRRKTIELRAAEPDAKRRSRLLDAFVKSPEFRAEMAREARREPGRGPKAYDGVADCYVRWTTTRASAAELGAVRKLDPRLAAMRLTELRALADGAPRLLLATAVSPRRAAELRRSVEAVGLTIEVQPA